MIRRRRMFVAALALASAMVTASVATIPPDPAGAVVREREGCVPARYGRWGCTRVEYEHEGGSTWVDGEVLDALPDGYCVYVYYLPRWRRGQRQPSAPRDLKLIPAGEVGGSCTDWEPFSGLIPKGASRLYMSRGILPRDPSKRRPARGDLIYMTLR